MRAIFLSWWMGISKSKHCTFIINPETAVTCLGQRSPRGQVCDAQSNDLTSFILSSAPSSLGTNKYPKLKTKINRRGSGKVMGLKIDAVWKKHSTDELYLFRGLQERHQPAEIWIRAQCLLSALCQTQTHIEHSGCSGIFTTRPRN